MTIKKLEKKMAELEYATKKIIVKTERLTDEDSAFAIYKKRLEDNLNYSGPIASHRYKYWHYIGDGIHLSRILDLLTLRWECSNCWGGQQENLRKNQICTHESLVDTIERIEDYCDKINSKAYSKTLEDIEKLKETYKIKRIETVDKINQILNEYINEMLPSDCAGTYQLMEKIMKGFALIRHLEDKQPAEALRKTCYELGAKYTDLIDLSKIQERRERAEVKIRKEVKELLGCMGIKDEETIQRYTSYTSKNHEYHTSLKNLITEATWLLLKYPEQKDELYWISGKAIRLPGKLVHEWNLESEFKNIKEAVLRWKAFDYPDYPC